MLEVPERSLGAFRKLDINYQISTFLESAPYSMCLQIVILESKRMLEVPESSLDGF